MFEIYYLPLHVEMGVEQPETPGMLISLPPRRTQRSRSQDVVCLYLTILKGTPPAARIVENMLEDTVSQYYKSTGSTTSGLRTAAEYLNSLLVDYNSGIPESSTGERVFAAFNMAVLKGELLSIMHAGPASTWLLQPGQVQTYENDEDRGKGLGTIAAVPIRFFQASIAPDSLILFCAKPSEKWTELDLTHGPRLTINLLRRRLLASDVEEFQAGVVQLKSSDQWAVHHLRLRSMPMAEPSEPAPAAAPAAASRRTARRGESETHRPRVESPVPEKARLRPSLFTRDASVPLASPTADETPEAEKTPILLEENDTAVSPVPGKLPPVTVDTLQGDLTANPAVSQIASEQYVKPHGTPGAESRVESHTDSRAESHANSHAETRNDPQKELERSARRQAFRKKLAGDWQSVHRHEQKMNSAARTFFTRLLPAGSDESPRLSGGTMLLISILVPLVVVFLAVSVYFEQGRGEQHKLYLDQARVFAAEARSAKDTGTIRNNWQQAIYWLDLAEDYQKSDDSKNLRSEAMTALDAMQGIERLEFDDLYSFGFPETLNFTQIAANDTEVYLLDSVGGSVMRMFLTGQGYQMDESFSCGPGISGTQVIGEFVDLVPLPAGNPDKAAVLAVDAVGNIAYCIPGAVAPLTSTLPVPEGGWGSIRAISLYQGSLYVLDSKIGAVYYYPGFTLGYGDEAQTFFDPERDETLPDLGDMVDLAAYGEDLYLLHKNGTLARCTSGVWETNQTRCEDPVSFGDIRPVQSDDTLLFTDTLFAQIQASTQPEPSLYLLDTHAPSIYRFSLQLNLDRLLRPALQTEASMPDTPATAFAISPSRQAFIAYGNRVFSASLVK